MNNEYPRSRQSPREIFSSVKSDYPLGEILIRLDLLAIIACNENQDLTSFAEENLTNFFLDISLPRQFSEQCGKFFRDHRLGFKLYSEGEGIKNPEIKAKFYIIPYILSSLTCQNSNSFEIDPIRNAAIEYFRSNAHIDVRCESLIDDIIAQYFNKTVGFVSLSNNTASILQRFTRTVVDFNALINHGAKPQIDIFSSTRYASTLCLLFSAINDYSAEGIDRGSAIKKNWKLYFKNTQLDETELLKIDDYIERDDYLKDLNLLFKYSLIDIKSNIIIKKIIVCSCALKILSQLPYNSSAEIAVDESISLIEKSKMVILDAKKTIEPLIKRFTLNDNTVDKRISDIFWHNKDQINTFYKMVYESVQSDESARRKAKWEDSITEHRQQVDILESQKKLIAASTTYSIIESLTSRSCGYILSKLYRYAYEFEDMQSEEIRMNIKQLIQILQLYGVFAYGSELLNKTVDDVKNYDIDIKTDSIPEAPDGIVLYPGWTVYGDKIIKPIGNTKPEEQS